MSIGLDSPMEALAINYMSQLYGGVAANINYVWAWIAFLTAAAISFWKIKLSYSVVHSSLQHLNSPCLSSPSPSPSHQPHTCSSADDIDHQPEEELLTALLTSSSLNLKSSSSSSGYTAFCSIENRRSGKFSMYYHDDEDHNNTSKPRNQLDDYDTTQSKLAYRSQMTACSTRHNNNPHYEEEKEKEKEEEEIPVISGPINYFKQPQEAAAGWKWEPVLLKMKTTEMVWHRYQDLTVLNGNVVRLWN